MNGKCYWKYAVLFMGWLLTGGSVMAQTEADLLIHHARIYTANERMPRAEAMAVKDGKILAVGTNADLLSNYKATRQLDMKGQAVFPGFIDAHSHFMGYGKALSEVNLYGTRSWEEVVNRLKEFAKDKDSRAFLVGRGWDQNDWASKKFPVNDKLNELFPNQPVFLERVDGHAAIVNNHLLGMAHIMPGKELAGGQIETVDGRCTGILIDNAMDLVTPYFPVPGFNEFKKWMQDAERNCFAAGLTSVSDCGLDLGDVEKIRLLQKNGDLKMRMYVMLSDKKLNFEYLSKLGPIKTDRLNVRSIKVYADGALGSRGACLLEPYSDKPGWSGFLLSKEAHFDSVAAMIAAKGWQMCTHAIGDSGNRVILKIYAKYLRGKNDLRWRIEHAQVVNKNDFHYFGDYTIIPSVQPTHATSDMYWADKRLGPKRIKGAYAYKQLLDQNGWIPLGTDFPVEDISPIKTFYAAVVRKDVKGYPAKGFQPENALSRQEALLGMTLWAARAAFEENEKGSLEPGKMADFVILGYDIMTCPAKFIPETRVIATYVGGEKVYGE